VARRTTVRVPLLGGDGELLLSGPDLCQYDYRNASWNWHVIYGQDNAPNGVAPGSTTMVGRGYPAGPRALALRPRQPAHGEVHGGRLQRRLGARRLRRGGLPLPGDHGRVALGP